MIPGPGLGARANPTGVENAGGASFGDELPIEEQG